MGIISRATLTSRTPRLRFCGPTRRYSAKAVTPSQETSPSRTSSNSSILRSLLDMTKPPSTAFFWMPGAAIPATMSPERWCAGRTYSFNCSRDRRQRFNPPSNVSAATTGTSRSSCECPSLYRSACSPLGPCFTILQPRGCGLHRIYQRVHWTMRARPTSGACSSVSLTKSLPRQQVPPRRA